MNAKHAQYRRTLAWIRMRPSYEELVAALEPFVGIRDQFPQTVKLINPKLNGLTPITVTVTKAQFLAAVAAIAKSRGEI